MRGEQFLVPPAQFLGLALQLFVLGSDLLFGRPEFFHRRLQFLVGSLHRILSLLERGDVGEGAHHADDVTVDVLQGAGTDQHVVFTAVPHTR